MLLDTERKLLRVLSNYFMRHKRPPKMTVLCAKMGRRVSEIERSLRKLNDLGYIVWQVDKPTELVILKEWEEDVIVRRTENQQVDAWELESF